VLALLVSVIVLAGCGSSASNNQQEPPRYRPNSNQNPGYDGSG
jgi:hypothetical protein